MNLSINISSRGIKSLKKKITTILILASIIFCIPMTKTKAAYPVPLADPANDVVIIYDSTIAITNVCKPSVDISELDVSIPSLEIYFTFYGTPVIDVLHKYNVTIFWSEFGDNYTNCFAGDWGTGLIYGSKTVLVNSSGITYYDYTNNTATVLGNTIIFPFNNSSPILARGMNIVEDSGGKATVPTEETTDGVTSTPNPDYLYTDTAGRFTWIPIPTNGGIELPIIITLLRTSFIIILVIRRKRNK